ncbi:MAG TPA: hypothetical protein PKH77_17775 [Anaerolineae bacterium]|nr:hypothetical protein [Anaerolineae bacterium]
MKDQEWSNERKLSAVSFLLIATVILLGCLIYDRQETLRAAVDCAQAIR